MITGIILAAGSGSRMNSKIKKQFMTLKEKPLIWYAIKSFDESEVDNIVLVTSEDGIKLCDNLAKSGDFKKNITVTTGGKERYDSVYEGLLCADNCEKVLIHDGARPLITKKIINDCIAELDKHKAIVVAVPCKDTIKIVDQNMNVKTTPQRSSLWAAQTPQAFDYGLIKECYDLMYKDINRKMITDDGMLVEYYSNTQVHLIMGDYTNIKITTPEDIEIAEKMMK